MLHTQLPAEFRVTSYSRVPTAIERIFYGGIIRNLAHRRSTLGLTQEELDQELGVSDGQVAKWESFARLPGAFMFVCWCNRLGLTLQLDAHAPIEPQQKAA